MLKNMKIQNLTNEQYELIINCLHELESLDLIASPVIVKKDI